MNEINETYYFADINSEFQYGQYIGLPLYYVLVRDIEYIYWTFNRIYDFKISKKALAQIHLFFPEFIISASFASHVVG